MALETVRIAVSSTAYTIIGTNVTDVTVEETRVGQLRAFVIPTGGTAPLVGSTDYVNFDGLFRYDKDVAVDIYMMSPNGATDVGVVRS